MFCDTNEKILLALRSKFEQYPLSRYDITYYHAPFQEVHSHKEEERFVVATAGNSFGIMGGGLDLSISRYFPDVERHVQSIIREAYYGELPVGTAIFVRVQSKRPFRGIIYTPTMRAPMHLNGIQATSIYTAMYAVLTEFEWTRDTTARLVIPGFGGGCGNVKPKIIANLIHLAMSRFKDKSKTPTNSREMLLLEQRIRRVATGLED